MKKIVLIAIVFFAIKSYAQVGINTNTPHTSSILDISSTTKGFLYPRMSHAQKTAIVSPTAGLVLWCTDCAGGVGQMQVYNGTSWIDVLGEVTNTITSNGTAIINSFSDCATATTGTLAAGVAVSGVTQTITLDVATVGTYTISAISNGVTFSSSGTFTSTGTQTLVLTASGTPTTGGTISFTLNTNPNCSFSRTILDFPPSALTYTGSPFIYTKGTAITPIASPTNTGGAVVSYSVSSLPAGLSLNTATGAITGTPTAVSASTNYTITATNSGGSTTTNINIKVNDILPSVAYSGTPFVYAINAAITPATPTNTGGAVVSYAINPSLPTGLSLNTATGVISGTPTAVSASSNYTITATNSGGSINVVISIEIVPVLDLANLNVITTASAYSLRKLSSTFTGTAIRVRRSSDNTEQNIGFNGSGDLDQVSLLSFVGSSDGFVTVWYDQSKNANNMIQANTLYQPRIVNAGVVEAVNSKPAVFLNTKFMAASLVAQNYPSTINGVATSKTATATGLFFAIGSNNGHAVGLGNNYTSTSTDYKLNGSKSGVTFMPTSGTLTPNSAAVITLNTLTGGDSSSITLNGGSNIITSGATNTPLTPTSGIVIGSNTPIASPTVMMSNGYIQEAIFIAASLTSPQKQALETNQAAYYSILPVINYPNNLTATYGTPVSFNPISLANVGTLAISPALPSGLSFNSTTGLISGTPSVLSSATTYTVTSTTGLGVGTASFSIAVNDIAPVVNYANTNLVLNDPAVISPTITSSGMIAATYSISPSLPAGLSLNTNSGIISGTPTSAISITGFTIIATNSGGTYSSNFNLYVGSSASPTNLTYTGSPFIFSVGTAITPINAPTNQGGAATSYTIDPSLPNGLIFNTSTGKISGNPTIITSALDYTVTAINSSGDTTTTINLTIIDAQPSNLQYIGTPFVFYMNNTYSITSPTYNGGIPTNYAISPSLPSGLTLNETTGAISGTPSVTSDATNYTITASNSSGSTNAIISIKILLPVLDLANFNVTTTASAYSLRKLRSNYTGAAIRVRRSSDNTEQNIGFDASGNLNQSALLSFVGSGSGWVSVWYDQSYNINNAVQVNVANQPRIVNSGAVDVMNGVPTLVFSGSQSIATPLVLARTTYPNVFINTVYKNTSISGYQALWGGDGGSWSRFQLLNFATPSGYSWGLSTGSGLFDYTSLLANINSNIYSMNSRVGIANGTNIFVNGVAGSSVIEGGNGAAPTAITLGAISPAGTRGLIGNISEFIISISDATNNERQALESNQGAYYGITVN